MSKMNELSLTLDQLITTGEKIVVAAKEIAECGTILIHTAKELQKVFSETSTDKVEVKRLPEQVVTYTKEDVRGMLAEKASAGYRAEVKELLNKYGASQLKQVDPSNYSALMEEAKVIGNV